MATLPFHERLKPIGRQGNGLKILLLNQVFYPDVVAVAQYLADLAADLGDAGHEVTVVCSERGYDKPAERFPRKEVWHGIHIRRIFVVGQGKKSKLRRILSSLSFFLSSFFALIAIRRQDVVVVTPPPPLLSFLAALVVHVRGGRLIYWNMDLNPDEAIAAGWLRADSLAAHILAWALRYSLRVSSSIIVLDRFMRDRIVAKGIPAEKAHVIPVWSLNETANFDLAGRELFRDANGLKNKFVVMYSGNHSPLHPLTTLLEAASRLKDNADVAFLFVGGGGEFERVKHFARDCGLTNISCLPYQPLDQLGASLSAADLQVVLLGDPFVGIVHPCKIYNIMAVGAPFLYIGPPESHIVDLQNDTDVARMGNFVRHGDVDRVVALIEKLSAQADSGEPRPGRPSILDGFARSMLMPRMIDVIESAATPKRDVAQ